MIRRVSPKGLSKLGKTLAVLVMAALLTWSIPQSNASAVTPYSTPLSYTIPHTGILYLYSNNPEILPAGNGYTMEKYLTTASYDVEFYHSIPGGGASRRVGVAIQNLTGSTATISIYAERAAVATTGSATGPAATVELAYQTQLALGAASISTISLPTGQSTIIVIPQNATISAGQTIIGKIRLSANVASLKLRVFYGNPADSAAAIMAYALTTYVAPGPGNYSGTTTGYFLHDELSASYAFSSGVLPFVLPGWSSDPAKNPIPPVSEYEAAQSIPTPWGPCGPLTSGVVVGGNYGMVYRISITGASGKHLHVTHPSGAGSFVAQAPGGLWYSYTSFPQDFYVTSTTPWVFKFVQPGGNSSNFYFSIIS